MREAKRAARAEAHQAGDGKPKAKFVRDANLEDGTQVLPRQLIVKEWEIENPTDQPWPADVKMILTRDIRALATAEEFPVPVAGPGEKVTVSAVLQTPTKPGLAEAYFRLADGQGNKFGQRFWVKLVVADTEEKNSPSPTEEKKSPLIPAPVITSVITPVVHKSTFYAHSNFHENSSEPEPNADSPLVVSDGADDFTIVPSPVASAPAAAAPAPVSPFEDQLQALASMGFDRALCEPLLETHNGSTEAVVEEMLNSL